MIQRSGNKEQFNASMYPPRILCNGSLSINEGRYGLSLRKKNQLTKLLGTLETSWW